MASATKNLRVGSERWTRVRMVKAETHGVVGDYVAKVQWPYIGKFVRIQLPPVRPDSGWFCDTKNVWRIHDDDVVELLGLHPGGTFFVCEHQIEID